ncbi:PadR family transcriptional regulator [Microbacterium sp. p3-SID336]|uniref:PadR family transcriptional regulator n=1 Tax=Microbacterium sp. p3-SID336 TaxID=2916212 RepID=UPI0021A532BD|nr:PadR family transcriptional regulator [Microbacterium sp. p3-SID336]MCT1479061.1 PadR family transcriptional regulator [Microbacterium sp. p3-SID336]
MSAVRLLVLGAVIDRGAAHGYQVRKDLESWRVDLWGNVAQGSIYHALRRLHSEGLIEQVDDVALPQGPARTRYRPTADGRRAFIELLEAMLSSDENTPEETVAGIGFLTKLTRPRAIELLEQRLESVGAKRDRVVREHELDPDAAWDHHVEAIRFWDQATSAEVAWIAQLLTTLRAGGYAMREE